MHPRPRSSRCTVLCMLVVAGGLSLALLLPSCRKSSTGKTPLVPAVSEDFADLADRDPAVTTAAWTLGSRSGLFATYGYGGNGEDGDLDLEGQLTLTSGNDPNRPPDADGVVEWNFASLRIAAGATLSLRGTNPIRLNVVGDALVVGTIDAAGQNGLNAPAGKASQVGRIPGGGGGPGAGAGGDANTNASHPVGSLPMELRGGPGYPRVKVRCGEYNRSQNYLITVIEPNCGGGTGGNRGLPAGTELRNGCSGNGGGHAEDGNQTDYLCTNIGAFGREYGQLWIMLTGPRQVAAPTSGTGGGAGGNAATSVTVTLPADDIVAGSGGGGGGGLEIACAGTLHLTPGSRIACDGGNGGAGYTTIVGTSTIHGGSGGGGSGGSLWLSATSVVTQTGAVLSARGGTGNPSPPNLYRTGNGGYGYVIVRDLGGDPILDATSLPRPVVGRETFTPAVNGTSLAVSRWYDSGTPDPQWTFNAGNPQTGEVVPGDNLVFANSPTAGQSVIISFQGAPEVNGLPDPDPTHWLPAGNTQQDPYAAFETDITNLRGAGMRFVRFRIAFDIGPRQKGQPGPNQIVVGRVTIPY
jgi:hypothetical protein